MHQVDVLLQRNGEKRKNWVGFSSQTDDLLKTSTYWDMSTIKKISNVMEKLQLRRVNL